MSGVKIILLSGKAGSGKSTLKNSIIAKLLANGHIPVDFRFAQPLYDIHNLVLGHLKDKYGVDRGSKDRKLLQILGTEYGRNCISPDIWVDCASKDLNDKLDAAVTIREQSRSSGSYIVAVCDDLRFKNEARAFKIVSNAKLVRLDAPEEIRRQRADMFPENTQHPSETDLDDFCNWDLVINTHQDTYLESKEISIKNAASKVLEVAGVPCEY